MEEVPPPFEKLREFFPSRWHHYALLVWEDGNRAEGQKYARWLVGGIAAGMGLLGMAVCFLVAGEDVTKLVIDRQQRHFVRHSVLFQKQIIPFESIPFLTASVIMEKTRGGTYGPWRANNHTVHIKAGLASSPTLIRFGSSSEADEEQKLAEATALKNVLSAICGHSASEGVRDGLKDLNKSLDAHWQKSRERLEQQQEDYKRQLQEQSDAYQRQLEALKVKLREDEEKRREERERRLKEIFKTPDQKPK